MTDAIRAELAAMEARAVDRAAAIHEKLDRFSYAVLHLAEHISQGTRDMSDTTDAIKADLAKLDATVDAAVAHASQVATDAIAAEQADLADIRTSIETISGKVECMVPTVAIAAAPPASASVAAAAPAVDPTGGAAAV